FAPLRYLHFLALAYLATALLRGREHLLLADWARPVVLVGRNSLPVFLLSMGLAQIAGMAADILGRDPAVLLLLHAAGLGTIVGFAWWCTLLKRQPWRRPEAERAARPAARDGAAGYRPGI